MAAVQSNEMTIILAAIDDMKKKMEERFNTLEAALQATQVTLAEHGTHLSSMEEASVVHDARLATLEQQVLKLTEASRLLQSKVSDLEARSRCMNVRII